MHRFFIPPDWIHAERVEFNGDTAHQIRSVLRLRAGERVCVLTGDGREHEVALTEVSGAAVNGMLAASRPSRGEPSHPVTLYQCLTQREKFEWILQKTVELGATGITPLISSRSLVRAWKQEDERKAERWRKILQEAAEQSERGIIPPLNPTCGLADALREAPARYDLCLIPWEDEQSVSLREALRCAAAQAPLRSLALFIGPEGGFSAEEIDLARQAGVIPVTLGPRILRTETAAMAALAMTLYELGEMD